MSKIFLILAIVAAGAAAFVANQNRQESAEVLQANKDLDKQTEQLERDNNSEQLVIDDTRAELATAQNNRDEAQARRDYSRSNLNNRVNEIKSKRDELSEVNSEIQEVVSKLELYNLPSPEALNAQLEEESAKKIELEEQIGEQTVSAQKLRQQVNDKRGVLGNLRDTLAERNAEFNVKARRATITQVNPEWGFAVIPMNATGVSVNDRVIVERGGQRVGMLVVKSVQPSEVVANIVPEASAGVTIQPGDTVIFEKKKSDG